MLLDWLFGLCLLVVVPASHLWSATRQPMQAPMRIARYWTQIATMLILLTLLLIYLWQRGQGAAALDLRFSLSASERYLMAGAIAFVALWYLALHGALRMADTDPALAQVFADVGRNRLMPRTAAEARLFVLFCIVIGSDLLYRGFLMNILSPVTGALAAILLAALADALTYGYDKPRDMAANLAFSLVLGIAAYLSRSLLWIMVLHLGIGLSGTSIAWQGIRRHGSM